MPYLLKELHARCAANLSHEVTAHGFQVDRTILTTVSLDPE